jgi:hypothetical protein
MLPPTSEPMTEMAASDPRHRTASKPKSALRTRTPRQARVNTAQTTTSSVGDLPENAFFADNDEEEFDEEDEYYSEDEDGDVFAFERPKTAAITNDAVSSAQPSRPQTAGVGSFHHTHRTTTGAESSRSVTFGFNVNDRPDTSAASVSSAPSLGFENLNELPYDPNGSHAVTTSHNINASAYNPHADLWSSQRPSVVSSTLVGRPSTGRTRGSQHFPADPHRMSGLSGDDYHYNEGMRDRKSLGDGIELSTYSLDTQDDRSRGRPGTQGTQATWNISELHGATTIPDGVTTKGDGLGGLHSKWGMEDGQSSAGAAAMDDLEEDSPYPEVRASVSNIDDPEMPGTDRSHSLMVIPVLTISCWLGLPL